MVNQARVGYGLLGAVAALAAGGVAAGGLVVQRRRRARIAAPSPFENLDSDRESTVVTEDGVRLHVEEVGPADAPLTVVLVHGFALSMRSFYYQRQALSRHFGDRVRLVFYDQRGHGKSGTPVPSSAGIDQLGRDLHTVLEAVAPDGPLVIVGHSMGGMTLLALVDQHPELFRPARRGRRPRVRAVALIATSSGRLADVSWGLPALLTRLRGPLAPMLLRTARRRAGLVERSRKIGADVAWVITRRFSFADPSVPPEAVDFLNNIIGATPIETIADFYPALMSYDLTRALPVLADADVLIVGADHDVMTPIAHSVVMAEQLPKAEFVRVPDAGHVVMLESPQVVNDALIELIERAARR